MNAEQGEERLTQSQIAARFGYTAAAVSNWRRRHADSFPAPDGDGRYIPQEVAAWLQQRQTREPGTADPMEQLLTRGRRSWAAQLATAGMVAAAAQGGDPIDWRRWRSLGSRFEAALELPPGAMAPAISALDDLPEGEPDELAALVLRLERSQYAEAFDALVDDRTAARASSGHVTTGDLTEAMLELLPPRAESVLDPACGFGRLLAAVALRVRASHVAGMEIDANAWAVAVQRMAVHRLAAEVGLGDFFDSSGEPYEFFDGTGTRYDLVIAQPPLNQRVEEGSPLEQVMERGLLSRRRVSGDYGWLFGALSRLTDRGRAFVVTSAGATVNTYDTDVRRELVRRGSVAAVIALPGGLIASTSVPAALWVLRRSAGPTEQMLFVNAEDDLGSGLEAARRWLYAPQEYRDEPGLCQTKPMFEVLFGDAHLAPAKYTSKPADPDASRHEASEALARFEATSKSLRRTTVPSIRLSTGPSVELTTLQALQDAKKLIIERPWHIPRSQIDDNGPIPYVTRISNGALDVTGYLKAPPRRQLGITQPGDVVMSTIGAPRAVIDEEGGRVLGSSLWLLRPRSKDPRFSARILTLLLANPRIASQAIGSTVRRLRSPADVSIPLLRHADALALTKWVESMEDLRRRALQLAEEAQKTLRTVSAAVDAGASIEPGSR